MVQSAAATIPIQKGEFSQDSALTKFIKVPKVTTDSLYLHATVDLDAHLTLDVQINSLNTSRNFSDQINKNRTENC